MDNDLEKLRAENEELKATISDNIERIGGLESSTAKAIEKKDRVLGLVRENFGIAEVSEETLKGIAAGGDETLKKENLLLQEKMQNLSKQFEQTQQTHKTEVDTMVLKDTLRGLGVADRTVNEVAFNELTNIVLSEAERDGANFIFRDNEGRTRFTESGKPMTVQDRIAELATSDRSFLFKEPSGGGATTSAGAKNAPPTSGTGTVNYIKDKFL